ncbi:MAG: TldD/PmbA family protein [Coriobacteriia bacterium]|nr:TldD/PmbA family protein [Coriobacteriia bacterium]
MRLSAEEALALATRAVGLTAADEAEAVVTSGSAALTRFAGNRIHQNVAERDTRLTLRAALGTRTGVASTNLLDEEALARCASAAVEAARHAPEDPGFPGLPAGESGVLAGRDTAGVTVFDASRRAEAAAAIIAPASAAGLVAAGTVSQSLYSLAVANSRGVARATSSGDVRATVLTMGASGGSGWASWLGASTAGFDPAAMGARAADTAARSAEPETLDPGTYTVVLAPEAVSDILEFMGWLGFGAKPLSEEGSFLAGRIGEQLVDPRITISDDALAPKTIGLGIDFEGQLRQRVPLIEAGVARGVVTDSYFAAKLGLPNTGHALPAPNPYGPLALNLKMGAGDTTEADMIASVERGVYVTRFHYVNVEEPMKLVLTGMTRDGTFMIENGQLTRPLKNLRFTQGILDAFSHLGAIGAERVLVGPGEGGATLVPALLLDRWEFTGQTG